MAGSLMTRDVWAVLPDGPLVQVQATLLRRRISQLAVVAADGHVLGWVSHRSLLRALSQKGPAAAGALPATAALAERGALTGGESSAGSDGDALSR
jgi:CBS domain-containing protein